MKNEPRIPFNILGVFLVVLLGFLVWFPAPRGIALQNPAALLAAGGIGSDAAASAQAAGGAACVNGGDSCIDKATTESAGGTPTVTETGKYTTGGLNAAGTERNAAKALSEAAHAKEQNALAQLRSIPADAAHNAERQAAANAYTRAVAERAAADARLGKAERDLEDRRTHDGTRTLYEADGKEAKRCTVSTCSTDDVQKWAGNVGGSSASAGGAAAPTSAQQYQSSLTNLRQAEQRYAALSQPGSGASQAEIGQAFQDKQNAQQAVAAAAKNARDNNVSLQTIQGLAQASGVSQDARNAIGTAIAAPSVPTGQAVGLQAPVGGTPGLVQGQTGSSGTGQGAASTFGPTTASNQALTGGVSASPSLCAAGSFGCSNIPSPGSSEALIAAQDRYMNAPKGSAEEVAAKADLDRAQYAYAQKNLADAKQNLLDAKARDTSWIGTSQEVKDAQANVTQRTKDLALIHAPTPVYSAEAQAIADAQTRLKDRSASVSAISESLQTNASRVTNTDQVAAITKAGQELQSLRAMEARPETYSAAQIDAQRSQYATARQSLNDLGLEYRSDDALAIHAAQLDTAMRQDAVIDARKNLDDVATSIGATARTATDGSVTYEPPARMTANQRVRLNDAIGTLNAAGKDLNQSIGRLNDTTAPIREYSSALDSYQQATNDAGARAGYGIAAAEAQAAQAHNAQIPLVQQVDATRAALRDELGSSFWSGSTAARYSAALASGDTAELERIEGEARNGTLSPTAKSYAEAIGERTASIGALQQQESRATAVASIIQSSPDPAAAAVGFGLVTEVSTPETNANASSRVLGTLEQRASNLSNQYATLESRIGELTPPGGIGATMVGTLSEVQQLRQQQHVIEEQLRHVTDAYAAVNSAVDSNSAALAYENAERRVLGAQLNALADAKTAVANGGFSASFYDELGRAESIQKNSDSILSGAPTPDVQRVINAVAGIDPMQGRVNTLLQGIDSFAERSRDAMLNPGGSAISNAMGALGVGVAGIGKAATSFTLSVGNMLGLTDVVDSNAALNTLAASPGRQMLAKIQEPVMQGLGVVMPVTSIGLSSVSASLLQPGTEDIQRALHDPYVQLAMIPTAAVLGSALNKPAVMFDKFGDAVLGSDIASLGKATNLGAFPGIAGRLADGSYITGAGAAVSSVRLAPTVADSLANDAFRNQAQYDAVAQSRQWGAELRAAQAAQATERAFGAGLADAGTFVRGFETAAPELASGVGRTAAESVPVGSGAVTATADVARVGDITGGVRSAAQAIETPTIEGVIAKAANTNTSVASVMGAEVPRLGAPVITSDAAAAATARVTGAGTGEVSAAFSPATAAGQKVDAAALATQRAAAQAEASRIIGMSADQVAALPETQRALAQSLRDAYARADAIPAAQLDAITSNFFKDASAGVAGAAVRTPEQILAGVAEGRGVTGASAAGRGATQPTSDALAAIQRAANDNTAPVVSGAVREGAVPAAATPEAAAAAPRAPPTAAAVQPAAPQSFADRVRSFFGIKPAEAPVATVDEALARAQTAHADAGITLKDTQVQATQAALDGSHPVLITGEGKSYVATTWADAKRSLVGESRPLELSVPTAEQAGKYANGQYGRMFENGGNKVYDLSAMNKSQGTDAVIALIKQDNPNALYIVDRELRGFLNDRAVTDTALRTRLASTDVLIDEVDAFVTDPAQAITSSLSAKAGITDIADTHVLDIQQVMGYRAGSDGVAQYRAFANVERATTDAEWNVAVSRIARSEKPEMLLRIDDNGLKRVEFSQGAYKLFDDAGIPVTKNSPTAGSVRETLQVWEEVPGAPNTHVIGDAPSITNPSLTERRVIPVSAGQEGKVSQVPTLRTQVAAAVRAGITDTAGISEVTLLNRANVRASISDAYAGNIANGRSVVGMTGTDGGGGVFTKMTLGGEVQAVKTETFGDALAKIPSDNVLPNWGAAESTIGGASKETNALLITSNPRELATLRQAVSEGRFGGNPAKAITNDIADGTTVGGKPYAGTVDSYVSAAKAETDVRAVGGLDMTRGTDFQGEWKNAISANMPASDMQQAIGRVGRIDPATNTRAPGTVYLVDAPEARVARLSDALQNPADTRVALETVGGNRAARLFDTAQRDYAAMPLRDKMELHAQLLEVDKQGTMLGSMASLQLDGKLVSGAYERIIGDDAASPWFKDIAQQRYERVINDHSTPADFSSGLITSRSESGNRVLQNSLDASTQLSKQELAGMLNDVDAAVVRGEVLGAADRAQLDAWRARIAEADRITNVANVPTLDKALPLAANIEETVGILKQGSPVIVRSEPVGAASFAVNTEASSAVGAVASNVARGDLVGAVQALPAAIAQPFRAAVSTFQGRVADVVEGIARGDFLGAANDNFAGTGPAAPAVSGVAANDNGNDVSPSPAGAVVGNDNMPVSADVTAAQAKVDALRAQRDAMPLAERAASDINQRIAAAQQQANNARIANEAAQTPPGGAGGIVTSAVKTVSDTVSSALRTIAGWMGFSDAVSSAVESSTAPVTDRAIQDRFIAAFNAVRDPAHQLSYNTDLAQAAYAYAQIFGIDPATGKPMHVDVNGSTPATRATNAGYVTVLPATGRTLVEENLAAGYGTDASLTDKDVQVLVNDWMASLDHHAVLVDTRTLDVGVGFSNGRIVAMFGVRDFGGTITAADTARGTGVALAVSLTSDAAAQIDAPATPANASTGQSSQPATNQPGPSVSPTDVQQLLQQQQSIQEQLKQLQDSLDQLKAQNPGLNPLQCVQAGAAAAAVGAPCTPAQIVAAQQMLLLQKQIDALTTQSGALDARIQTLAGTQAQPVLSFGAFVQQGVTNVVGPVASRVGDAISGVFGAAPQAAESPGAGAVAVAPTPATGAGVSGTNGSAVGRNVLDTLAGAPDIVTASPGTLAPGSSLFSLLSRGGVGVPTPLDPELEAFFANRSPIFVQALPATAPVTVASIVRSAERAIGAGIIAIPGMRTVADRLGLGGASIALAPQTDGSSGGAAANTGVGEGSTIADTVASQDPTPTELSEVIPALAAQEETQVQPAIDNRTVMRRMSLSSFMGRAMGVFLAFQIGASTYQYTQGNPFLPEWGRTVAYYAIKPYAYQSKFVWAFSDWSNPKATFALRLKYFSEGVSDEVSNLSGLFTGKHILERQALANLNDTKYSLDHLRRLDAWRLYLSMPQKYDTFETSPYAPGISSNAQKTYVRIKGFWTMLLRTYPDMPTDATEADVARRVYNELWVRGVDKRGTLQMDGQDFAADIMGNFTFGASVDDKGRPYISYYDRWDLGGSSEGERGIIGKPYDIYDRYYFDPKTFARIYPERDVATQASPSATAASIAAQSGVSPQTQAILDLAKLLDVADAAGYTDEARALQGKIDAAVVTLRATNPTAAAETERLLATREGKPRSGGAAANTGVGEAGGVGASTANRFANEREAQVIKAEKWMQESANPLALYLKDAARTGNLPTVVISVDASGRLTAETARQLVQGIARTNNPAATAPVLLAYPVGTGVETRTSDAEAARITRDVVAQIPDGASVLIADDTVQTGNSIRPLLNALDARKSVKVAVLAETVDSQAVDLPASVRFLDTFSPTGFEFYVLARSPEIRLKGRADFATAEGQASPQYALLRDTASQLAQSMLRGYASREDVIAAAGVPAPNEPGAGSGAASAPLTPTQSPAQRAALARIGGVSGLAAGYGFAGFVTGIAQTVRAAVSSPVAFLRFSLALMQAGSSIGSPGAVARGIEQALLTSPNPIVAVVPGAQASVPTLAQRIAATPIQEARTVTETGPAAGPVSVPAGAGVQAATFYSDDAVVSARARTGELSPAAVSAFSRIKDALGTRGVILGADLRAYANDRQPLVVLIPRFHDVPGLATTPGVKKVVGQSEDIFIDLAAKDIARYHGQEGVQFEEGLPKLEAVSGDRMIFVGLENFRHRRNLTLGEFTSFIIDYQATRYDALEKTFNMSGSDAVADTLLAAYWASPQFAEREDTYRSNSGARYDSARLRDSMRSIVRVVARTSVRTSADVGNQALTDALRTFSDRLVLQERNADLADNIQTIAHMIAGRTGGVLTVTLGAAHYKDVAMGGTQAPNMGDIARGIQSRLSDRGIPYIVVAPPALPADDQKAVTAASARDDQTILAGGQVPAKEQPVPAPTKEASLTSTAPAGGAAAPAADAERIAAAEAAQRQIQADLVRAKATYETLKRFVDRAGDHSLDQKSERHFASVYNNFVGGEIAATGLSAAFAPYLDVFEQLRGSGRTFVATIDGAKAVFGDNAAQLQTLRTRYADAGSAIQREFTIAKLTRAYWTGSLQSALGSILGHFRSLVQTKKDITSLAMTQAKAVQNTVASLTTKLAAANDELANLREAQGAPALTAKANLGGPAALESVDEKSPAQPVSGLVRETVVADGYGTVVTKIPDIVSRHLLTEVPTTDWGKKTTIIMPRQPSPNGRDAGKNRPEELAALLKAHGDQNAEYLGCNGQVCRVSLTAGTRAETMRMLEGIAGDMERLQTNGQITQWTFSSLNRSNASNKAVTGFVGSDHLLGDAADLTVFVPKGREHAAQLAIVDVFGKNGALQIGMYGIGTAKDGSSALYLHVGNSLFRDDMNGQAMPRIWGPKTSEEKPGYATSVTYSDVAAAMRAQVLANLGKIPAASFGPGIMLADASGKPVVADTDTSSAAPTIARAKAPQETLPTPAETVMNSMAGGGGYVTPQRIIQAQQNAAQRKAAAAATQALAAARASLPAVDVIQAMRNSGTLTDDLAGQIATVVPAADGLVLKDGTDKEIARLVSRAVPQTQAEFSALATHVKAVITNGVRLGFVIGDINDPGNPDKEVWIWTREASALNDRLAAAGLPTLAPVYTRHYFGERDVRKDGTRAVNTYQLQDWKMLTAVSAELPGRPGQRVFNFQDGPDMAKLMAKLKDGETGDTGLRSNQNYVVRDMLRVLVLSAAGLGMDDVGYILAATENGHANHKNGNDVDFRPGPRVVSGDPHWWLKHTEQMRNALGTQYDMYAVAFNTLGITRDPQSGFYGSATGHIGTDNPSSDAWNQGPSLNPWLARVFGAFKGGKTKQLTFDDVRIQRDVSVFADQLSRSYTVVRDGTAAARVNLRLATRTSGSVGSVVAVNAVEPPTLSPLQIATTLTGLDAASVTVDAGTVALAHEPMSLDTAAAGLRSWRVASTVIVPGAAAEMLRVMANQPGSPSTDGGFTLAFAIGTVQPRLVATGAGAAPSAVQSPPSAATVAAIDQTFTGIPGITGKDRAMRVIVPPGAVPTRVALYLHGQNIGDYVGFDAKVNAIKDQVPVGTMLVALSLGDQVEAKGGQVPSLNGTIAAVGKTIREKLGIDFTQMPVVLVGYSGGGAVARDLLGKGDLNAQLAKAGGGIVILGGLYGNSGTWSAWLREHPSVPFVATYTGENDVVQAKGLAEALGVTIGTTEPTVITPGARVIYQTNGTHPELPKSVFGTLMAGMPTAPTKMAALTPVTAENKFVPREQANSGGQYRDGKRVFLSLQRFPTPEEIGTYDVFDFDPFDSDEDRGIQKGDGAKIARSILAQGKELVVYHVGGGGAQPEWKEKTRDLKGILEDLRSGDRSIPVMLKALEAKKIALHIDNIDRLTNKEVRTLVDRVQELCHENGAECTLVAKNSLAQFSSILNTDPSFSRKISYLWIENIVYDSTTGAAQLGVARSIAERGVPVHVIGFGKLLPSANPPLDSSSASDEPSESPITLARMERLLQDNPWISDAQWAPNEGVLDPTQRLFNGSPIKVDIAAGEAAMPKASVPAPTRVASLGDQPGQTVPAPIRENIPTLLSPVVVSKASEFGQPGDRFNGADRMGGSGQSLAYTRAQGLFVVASTKYPIGTYLAIRNPSNGKVAIVQVGERGPYDPAEALRGRLVPHATRDLDLFRTVVNALGLTPNTIYTVEYAVVAHADPGTSRYIKGRTDLGRQKDTAGNFKTGYLGVFDTLAPAAARFATVRAGQNVVAAVSQAPTVDSVQAAPVSLDQLAQQMATAAIRARVDETLDRMMNMWQRPVSLARLGIAYRASMEAQQRAAVALRDAGAAGSVDVPTVATPGETVAAGTEEQPSVTGQEGTVPPTMFERIISTLAGLRGRVSGAYGTVIAGLRTDTTRLAVQQPVTPSPTRPTAPNVALRPDEVGTDTYVPGSVSDAGPVPTPDDLQALVDRIKGTSQDGAFDPAWNPYIAALEANIAELRLPATADQDVMTARWQRAREAMDAALVALGERASDIAKTGIASSEPSTPVAETVPPVQGAATPVVQQPSAPVATAVAQPAGPVINAQGEIIPVWAPSNPGGLIATARAIAAPVRGYAAHVLARWSANQAAVDAAQNAPVSFAELVAGMRDAASVAPTDAERASSAGLVSRIAAWWGAAREIAATAGEARFDTTNAEPAETASAPADTGATDVAPPTPAETGQGEPANPGFDTAQIASVVLDDAILVRPLELILHARDMAVARAWYSGHELTDVQANAVAALVAPALAENLPRGFDASLGMDNYVSDMDRAVVERNRARIVAALARLGHPTPAETAVAPAETTAPAAETRVAVDANVVTPEPVEGVRAPVQNPDRTVPVIDGVASEVPSTPGASVNVGTDLNTMLLTPDEVGLYVSNLAARNRGELAPLVQEFAAMDASGAIAPDARIRFVNLFNIAGTARFHDTSATPVRFVISPVGARAVAATIDAARAATYRQNADELDALVAALEAKHVQSAPAVAAAVPATPSASGGDASANMVAGMSQAGQGAVPQETRPASQSTLARRIVNNVPRLAGIGANIAAITLVSYTGPVIGQLGTVALIGAWWTSDPLGRAVATIVGKAMGVSAPAVASAPARSISERIASAWQRFTESPIIAGLIRLDARMRGVPPAATAVPSGTGASTVAALSPADAATLAAAREVRDGITAVLGAYQDEQARGSGVRGLAARTVSWVRGVLPTNVIPPPGGGDSGGGDTTKMRWLVRLAVLVGLSQLVGSDTQMPPQTDTQPKPVVAQGGQPATQADGTGSPSNGAVVPTPGITAAPPGGGVPPITSPGSSPVAPGITVQPGTQPAPPAGGAAPTTPPASGGQTAPAKPAPGGSGAQPPTQSSPGMTCVNGICSNIPPAAPGGGQSGAGAAPPATGGTGGTDGAGGTGGDRELGGAGGNGGDRGLGGRGGVGGTRGSGGAGGMGGSGSSGVASGGNSIGSNLGALGGLLGSVAGIMRAMNAPCQNVPNTSFPSMLWQPQTYNPMLPCPAKAQAPQTGTPTANVPTSYPTATTTPPKPAIQFVVNPAEIAAQHAPIVSWVSVNTDGCAVYGPTGLLTPRRTASGTIKNLVISRSSEFALVCAQADGTVMDPMRKVVRVTGDSGDVQKAVLTALPPKAAAPQRASISNTSSAPSTPNDVQTQTNAPVNTGVGGGSVPVQSCAPRMDSSGFVDQRYIDCLYQNGF